MNKKIAVIGIGTAGVTSLSHLLTWVGGYDIYSVYDPNVPILGIGESTTIQIPANLFKGANFSLFKDSHELDATIKHGVKYVGWREEDIYSHIVPPYRGMHINNFRIKEFTFPRFEKLWGDRFKQLTGSVTDVYTAGEKAVVVIDGKPTEFDYVVDCRGYPEDYSDYTISDLIPVNHCLVHTVDKPGDWEWTYHVAHRNGWMFGIPLQTRQGWGYLYNDTITSKEDAISDISERFNVPEEQLTKTLREFSFKNYNANKFLDGRVMKNGNRALFFEPIEAMSGWFYDYVIRKFVDCVLGGQSQDRINYELTEAARDLETVICFLYHGGSTYDSEFWKVTSQRSSDHIKHNNKFQSMVQLWKFLPKTLLHDPDIHPFGGFSAYSMHDFDKNFGYHYFTTSEDKLS